MDVEHQNIDVEESGSAKRKGGNLTVEQRAKESNIVKNYLMTLSQTLHCFDKYMPDMNKLDESNLASVKQNTTRKSKKTVTKVLFLLLLGIFVAGLALTPVLLFLHNTNVPDIVRIYVY